MIFEHRLQVAAGAGNLPLSREKEQWMPRLEGRAYWQVA
jgi:hypothetical protein